VGMRVEVVPGFTDGRALEMDDRRITNRIRERIEPEDVSRPLIPYPEAVLRVPPWLEGLPLLGEHDVEGVLVVPCQGRGRARDEVTNAFPRVLGSHGFQVD